MRVLWQARESLRLRARSVAARERGQVRLSRRAQVLLRSARHHRRHGRRPTGAEVATREEWKPVDLFPVGAAWLHLLATVALLGYYAVLAVIVVPVLRRALPAAQLAAALAAVERRALPLIIGSLAVFLATGIYLMGADARYGGVGSIGSTWASVLLVKHIVVIAMVGVGLVVDALFVRVAALEDGQAQARALGHLTLGLRGMTLLAAVVLLLTAVAQSS